MLNICYCIYRSKSWILIHMQVYTKFGTYLYYIHIYLQYTYSKVLGLWELLDALVADASKSVKASLTHHLEVLSIYTINTYKQRSSIYKPCMFFCSVGICTAITLRALVKPELRPTLNIWSRRLSILALSWVPSALASWLIQQNTFGSTTIVRTFLNKQINKYYIKKTYRIRNLWNLKS